MTTRFDKTQSSGQAIDLGLELNGPGIPGDLVVPSCSIEDVDRSVWFLFKDQIPLYFDIKGAQQRVPVIFATGERYAILTRRKPLRDQAGAIILPLISIFRSGLTQKSNLATNQTLPITFKRKIAEEDQTYQNLINKSGIKNQNNVASSSRSSPSPGQIATRRKNSIQRDISVSPQINSQNIYEFITMPPAKFFKATYEITIWCDYTTQMNKLLDSIMISYQDSNARTFRLETDKGYWFVGKVEEELTTGNNFDNFSEEERLVKYSFNMEVNAFSINPDVDGIGSNLRRFLSSPQINFEMQEYEDQMNIPQRVGAPSGQPSDFILQDELTLDDPITGQGIANTDSVMMLDTRGNMQRRIESATTSVGGTIAGSDGSYIRNQSGQKVIIKSRNTRKGETSFRTFNDLTIEDLFG
jgi:hypothetical protein